MKNLAVRNIFPLALWYILMVNFGNSFAQICQ